MSEDFVTLTREVVGFRDERNWAQFHTLKDNALSILIEASEFAEAVRWKSPEDISNEKIAEELADVLYWILLTAHDRGIDLPRALRDKLSVNAEHYPVDKASGNAKKYSEF